MISSQEEAMAQLANDLFNKRQRLIEASRPNAGGFDERSIKAAQSEYQEAEADYLAAKAAFARAMKIWKSAS